MSDWYCATGEYELFIGASSRDIRLSAKINLKSSYIPKLRVTQDTLVEELLANPKTAEAVKGYIENSPIFSINKNESEIASAAINAQMAMRMMAESPIRIMRMIGGISNKQLNALIDQLNSLLD